MKKSKTNKPMASQQVSNSLPTNVISPNVSPNVQLTNAQQQQFYNYQQQPVPQQIPQQNSLFSNAQQQQMMNSNVPQPPITNFQQQLFQQQPQMQMPIQQISQPQMYGAYGRTRGNPVVGNHPAIFNDD